MNILTFNKLILNIPKLDKQLREHSTTKPTYSHLYSKGSTIDVHFTQNCSQAVVDAASSIVNNFVEVSVKDQLKDYVESEVTPFIQDFLYTIQAENIEQEITQLGKTSEVLGFFTQAIVLPGKTRAVSLKQTLDANSLNVTLELLNHYILHPDTYSDLSPFITTDRLVSWRDKIIEFLS